MSKMSCSKLDVPDLIEGLKSLFLDENDLVSKSPMRTHDCSNHCSKPYGYRHGSTSRTIGGVTKVVESDETFNGDSLQTLQYLQPVPVIEKADLPQDVDIADVHRWLNLCSKNPEALEEFVAHCNKELSKKDSPSTFHERSFTTLQQYKTDVMSLCSNSSSQISSPAQSPSEHNVTSPESVSCEENSLYHSMSPVIPSLECINIKPVDESEHADRLLAGACHQEDPLLKYSEPCTHPSAPPKASDSRTIPRVNSPGLESVSPNIGTLMLNLAADTYESTIDLAQFTGTLKPEASSTYHPTEKESLNDKLDPKAKQSAWIKISQVNVDSLGKGDAEGDTQLMILLVSEKVTLEYIYVIVERLLNESAKYLALRNEQNQDALFLAAMILKQEPLVASYIAEALVRGSQDVNRKYDEGNTLLHCLAKAGDSHAKVLERLVRLKNQDNTPAFDINKKNNRGHTPLHVACEVHKPEGVRTCQTVRILLENGADCTEKEYIDENTPLHILINESCDTELLNILLETSRKFRRKDSPLPTTIANRQGNTSLHLACRRNSLDIPVQKEVVELLRRHGAMIQLKNINGCVPSVLVDTSRKQEIKRSLYIFREK